MLFRNSLSFLVISFLMMACEKDPEPLTANSMIRGHVYWISDPPIEGKVKMTAKGPYGSKSVEVSNNNEDLIIDKLGNGTYCVEFAKDGFGTYNQCDVQLFGNDTIRIYVQLYPKPKAFKMPVLTRAYISYPDFYNPPTVPCISLATDAKDRDIQPELKIYIGTSTDVSWENYRYVTSGFRSSYNTGNNSWIFYISLEYPETLPFQTGEKVYIRTYACNIWDRGYVDAYLGIMIFPTLDKTRASNAIEFVMP